MSVRSEASTTLRENVIKQQCVVLHLPTVASQCAPLAEQAERERQPYLGYLEALFAAELEDRERRAIERRIKEAHLPRVKTLDEFDFRQAPSVLHHRDQLGLVPLPFARSSCAVATLGRRQMGYPRYPTKGLLTTQD